MKSKPNKAMLDKYAGEVARGTASSKAKLNEAQANADKMFDICGREAAARDNNERGAQ